MDGLVKFRNNISSFLYKNIAKKIFFKLNPERVHERMVLVGKKLGNFTFTRKITAFFFDYRNDFLSQEILGLRFSNPVGLAAGFDKNAEMTEILPAVGFGFGEIGSVTGEPCLGNTKPRLWRLVKSQSIVVNYGLKNDGCEEIAKRLRNKKFGFPLGISIAQTNDLTVDSMEKGVEDYLKSYRAFERIGGYITINISCPNSQNSCSFLNPDNLEKLLERIAIEKKEKPIFIKISPDLGQERIDDIIQLVEKYKIDGLICSNLTKKRDLKRVVDGNIPVAGGLSGKAVEKLSNDLIRYVYARTQGRFVIIGCGGVFSAEDAYKKIKLGASLIQLITGMIFEGPQVISDINLGLVKLLKKDGYKSITEAVGTDITL